MTVSKSKFTFCVSFTTSDRSVLRRAVVGDDKHDDDSIGARWFSEVLDGHWYDDEDSDWQCDLSIHSMDELFTLVRRINAHNAKISATSGSPLQHITPGGSQMRLTCHITHIPFTAYATTKLAHIDAYSSIERTDNGKAMSDAIEMINQGLSELRRV